LLVFGGGGAIIRADLFPALKLGDGARFTLPPPTCGGGGVPVNLGGGFWGRLHSPRCGGGGYVAPLGGVAAGGPPGAVAGVISPLLGVDSHSPDVFLLSWGVCSGGGDGSPTRRGGVGGGALGFGGVGRCGVRLLGEVPRVGGGWGGGLGVGGAVGWGFGGGGGGLGGGEGGGVGAFFCGPKKSQKKKTLQKKKNTTKKIKKKKNPQKKKKNKTPKHKKKPKKNKQKKQQKIQPKNPTKKKKKKNKKQKNKKKQKTTKKNHTKKHKKTPKTKKPIPTLPGRLSLFPNDFSPVLPCRTSQQCARFFLPLEPFPRAPPPPFAPA